MTATENIFLAWALFSGGVTLLVAILIYYSTRRNMAVFSKGAF
jgi:hypothetical protein